MTSPDLTDGNTPHSTRMDGEFLEFQRLENEDESALPGEVAKAQSPANHYTPAESLTEEHVSSPIVIADDDALLAEAQNAQNTANYYTPRPFAELLAGPDFAGRGKIIGMITFPVPSKDNSSFVLHSDRLGHSLLAHRRKRVAVVVSQKGPELQGEFRFIPIHELPETQDPGSLKKLSYRKVMEMLEKAGGNKESIADAFREIPNSTMWSNESVWRDHGGRPHRRGATKRNPSSYHFHATPRDIDRRNKHMAEAEK